MVLYLWSFWLLRGDSLLPSLSSFVRFYSRRQLSVGMRKPSLWCCSRPRRRSSSPMLQPVPTSHELHLFPHPATQQPQLPSANIPLPRPSTPIPIPRPRLSAPMPARSTPSSSLHLGTHAEAAETPTFQLSLLDEERRGESTSPVEEIPRRLKPMGGTTTPARVS
jgi:hypothetical protein